ncbi:hypothetical protein [Streptomyces sp. DSM 40750]|uniref:hypothetical protein n=1 Tax=Streptomyces sp. DSM 40750 TaxID=2801030 RepID=UPI00214C3CC6|nr:hypothetical protein [Streptomyces sp. DSM 40750]UUU23857.1 hypothetical protein JIX55_28380 [Streptomyces sp. DSM 40750]
MPQTNGDRRTSRARTAAARLTGTALALSLVLLTGCSGGSDDGDDKGDAEKSAGPGGGTGSAVAYDGPRLPGFAAKPAWSLPAAGGDAGPGVLDLGGTLLFARDASGAYLGDFDDSDVFSHPNKWESTGPDYGEVRDPNRVLHISEAPQPLTLEFRDAKTGEVRRSLKATTDSVTLTTWHDGARAVAVGTTGTTGSDGLTAAKTTSTAALYDAGGRELGETPLPRTPDRGLYYAGALTEGYRVEAVDRTVRLTPVDGGTARTVSCAGDDATCEYDPKTGLMSTGQRRAVAPPVLGGHYVGFEDPDIRGYDMTRITLHDLATGKQVWSSADAEIPPGVKVYDNDDDASPKPMPEAEELSLLRVTDGKVLVAWKATLPSDGDAWIHAWYDLRTGALTESYEATESVLFAPSGDLAAEDVPLVTYQYTGTRVWRLPDGEELWAQEDGSGETPLDPLRFTADGSVLYGLAGREGDAQTGLAVDPRTREVLAKDLPVDHVPTVDEPTGYGHVSTAVGFFAFPPAS